MNKTRFLLAFFLFAFPFTSEEAIWAKPQRKVVRRTVLDYFRLLPMDAGIFEAEKRESLIGKHFPHIIDLKNDYMQVTGDGAQPSFQIAVFRYRGRDLVAVSSVIGGPDYFFDLRRYENGKWKKVTAAVSPLVSSEDSDLHFVLPWHGTTIQVFRRNGTLAAQLLWENGNFSAKKIQFNALRH